LDPLDSRIPKASLAGDAYTRIRGALISGEITPGQRLSEPELALRFRTSRSPVREALLRLEHDGFLDRAPSGQVRVKPLDISDFEQLYVIRANVEGLAVRLATPRLRTIDLEEMESRLEEMQRCAKKGDSDGAIAAGQGFHDVITRECGNPLLVDILAGLRARISRFRILVASLGGYDKEKISEYRGILKALYQRDAAQAETEMIRHVNRSAAAFVSKLRKRIDSHK
jgi:DNA-binding GntR family transcriptional regulator